MPTQEIQQGEILTRALGIVSSHSESKNSEPSVDQVKQSKGGRSVSVGAVKGYVRFQALDVQELNLHQNSDRARATRRKKIILIEA